MMTAIEAKAMTEKVLAEREAQFNARAEELCEQLNEYIEQACKDGLRGTTVFDVPVRYVEAVCKILAKNGFTTTVTARTTIQIGW